MSSMPSDQLTLPGIPAAPAILRDFLCIQEPGGLDQRGNVRAREVGRERSFLDVERQLCASHGRPEVDANAPLSPGLRVAVAHLVAMAVVHAQPAGDLIPDAL